MRLGWILLALCVAGGCATPGSGPEPAPAPQTTQEKEDRTVTGPLGEVDIDVTNVLGVGLGSRVDLHPEGGAKVIRIYAPGGQTTADVPQGNYRAYVQTYESDIPMMVAALDLTVQKGKTAFVAVNLIEGSGGKLGLQDFDYDADLALDRVELECGTNPEDPRSIPGKDLIPVNESALPGGGLKWYCGELNAHSRYGRGAETVGELVRRAEKEGMDFLAITDRDTVASVYDPEFHSNKVVLIPAMAWGNDGAGEALIYGPRTLPDPAESIYQAQAECMRVQAQGGVFSVGHPCLAENPWKWGVSFVNAIQAWYGPWSGGAPLQLDQLEPDLLARDDKGRLLFPIAAAAAMRGEGIIETPDSENPNIIHAWHAELGSLSSNMQNMYFWDLELVRGLIACGIAGSGTDSSKVPMGRPVTYILARDKSVPALLEGLRLGRTVLAAQPGQVFVEMRADVLRDDKADAIIGDIIPLHEDVRLWVQVVKGAGKKLEVLQNGLPILTKSIDTDQFAIPIVQKPDAPCAYRRASSARRKKAKPEWWKCTL